MRRIEGENLWIGHVGDLGNVPAHHAAGIEAVVELVGEELPTPLPRGFTTCRFPLMDGAGNAPWLLRLAVATTAHLLRTGTPMLIACGAGMSRSPAVAAAALAIARGSTLGESLDRVTQSVAADVSPALWTEILAALG